MKELWVMSAMLSLFFFFISAQESLVFGQTNSSLGQSRVVTGVYDNKETVPSAAVSLNMTQWTTTDSSFFATKNLQTTVITSNNKGNEVSFTKASTEKVLPALSTRLVAKSQLNEFIKSLLSTNVLPENLSTKYSSLNTQRSVFNDKEDNFTISSIPSAMTPEIVPTTSQVNGIKTSSSRDKMHLSTFQKEDKSLVSSQEASTKSAFYDTRGESKGFNLRTVQFTSSPIFSPILVEINSATVVRANNETNLFTKGSVSLAHWQRTFSIRSAIWKTSELKPFSETTSHSSPDKETSQHSTQTFDTKMSTEAMKVKFTGISGISQNTAEAKMTPEDKGFISPFDISTSPAIEIAATSAGASVAHRPPSTKHKNLSFSLVVTASPVVSSRSKRFLSTDTMTIPTTPLNQLSVTSVKGSNFSSKTKTEFRALTKEVTKGYTGNHYGLSSILAHAGSSHSPSNMAQQSPNSNQSIYESTPFVVPVGTLPPSEVSQGMQTVSSIKSKTSEQNYVMSSSSEEYFPVSVNTTENVVRKTSVNLKLISKVLDENLSSPYSSQTMFKTHSTDWAVSTASDEFSPLNSGSNHQLPMSRSISDINHHFSFSQSSVVSPVLVAPSPFTTRSPSKIPDAVSSTLNVRRDIDSSSSQSLFAVTPSSLHITSRSTIPHRTSTIRTGSYHEPLPSATTIGYQIRFSSSQSSAVSSEILATSSSPMTSRLQVSHDKNSAVTTSYHKPLISASKIRHQIHLSSPRSAPLFTELVESTSSRQRPSQVPQEKSPFAKESYYQTVISTSDGRHQIPFTASYSSVVTTDYVAPTSSPVISGSEILYHRNSLTSHLRSRSPITHGAISSVTSSHQKCPTSSVTGHQIQFSSRKPAMSTTASSSFLKSPSQIAHKARSVSIYGNSTSDLQSRLLSQSVVMSTEVLQPLSQPTSHFQTPLTTTHVTTSIFPKLRPSFSEIGNQARFSSQSSVGSKELVSPSSRHTKSHFQTPHSTAFVSSSTFQEHLPSTSKIGHHVYFSSAQKSVASTELIAPSLRHTKSYFQTPHSTASVTRSTFQEHLPSTSENGHHVHFSSAPLTSTELVAPSSHPRISSHVAEKRSSAGSKRQTSSSSSRSTAPTSFNKGKLKASSLAVSASQSGKEFTSKIKIPPVPVESIDTTVTPTEPTTTSSPAVAANLSTGQSTTAATNVGHMKLLILVAIVPSIVLCVFFAAVMLFRRKRRRRNNFKYSIKLEYKDSIRSRCMNSRLDLSLKGIHIDLELPNVPSERAQSRDSTGYSRGPSLTETQMRELQILSQECKENLEWISEVIARDMETSICPRQALNRESVYSVKEKGSYEPSAKIIRRESSKRGRETVTWRVPIVRRRDSVEFGQRDSICTDDTTLTPDWKEEGDCERSNYKNVDRTGKDKQSPHVKRNVETLLNKDFRGPLSNKTLDEQEKQGKVKEEKELEENKLTASMKPKREETSQGKRSGKRFETL